MSSGKDFGPQQMEQEPETEVKPTAQLTGIHKFNAEFEAMMKMDKFFDENDDDLLKDVKLDL